MNTLRQAIAGPSRCLHSIALPEASASAGTDLPPVISRYIKRHLARKPTATTIPNPFLVHRTINASSASEIPSNSYTERYISRRREKQLRYWFDPSTLPPSPLTGSFSNGIAGPSVQAARPSGELAELSWLGDVVVRTKKRLYEGRRVIFKGHKHERGKPERRRETEERLAGMDKRVATWKNDKVEAKQSTKPSLPF